MQIDREWRFKVNRLSIKVRSNIQIGQLDSSLLIFQGAPDYAEKAKLLDQFKNRLEASLSSSVITAVQAQDRILSISNLG